MRILASLNLSQSFIKNAPGRNVLYRPELEGAPSESIAELLEQARPHGLICRTLPDDAALVRWRNAMGPHCWLAVVVIDPQPADFRRGAPLDISIAAPLLDQSTDTYEGAFLSIERLYNRYIANHEAQPKDRQGPFHRSKDTVLLIGAGIVNLVTALGLQSDGYAVELLDKGPDPRSDPDWRLLGCTHGGDNARMFTLSEADNYHYQGPLPWGRENERFRRPLAEGGWLISSHHGFSDTERSWIAAYEAVPPWLARAYNRDVFHFNRESQELWAALQRQYPSIFDTSNLCRNILRLYSESNAFAAASERQKRIGAFKRALSVEDLMQKYPALASACSSGAVAGGIEVEGFTLNIHQMTREVLNVLSSGGAKLHWGARVDSIVQVDAKSIAGVRMAGGIKRAQHYVLSPGAANTSLMKGIYPLHPIQGVLGAWIKLPNLEPRLQTSLKIGRTGHATEDSNVTLSTELSPNDTLIIGSGYGYTGTSEEVESARLSEMFAAIEDTASVYFPKNYAVAQRTGSLLKSRKYCVRPWTPSCLGHFDMRSTDDGGKFIVTGGHNTGGFAQAPSVAEAVRRALNGETHDMHVYYHPDRTVRFMQS